MILYYLGIFLLNLTIESLVAFILGRRSKKDYLAVLAVNGVTHPVLTLLLMSGYRLGVYSLGLVLVLEVVVVVVEWRLFVYMYRAEDKKLLIQAIAMNVVSYVIGVLIQ